MWGIHAEPSKQMQAWPMISHVALAAWQIVPDLDGLALLSTAVCASMGMPLLISGATISKVRMCEKACSRSGLCDLADMTGCWRHLLNDSSAGHVQCAVSTTSAAAQAAAQPQSCCHSQASG